MRGQKKKTERRKAWSEFSITPFATPPLFLYDVNKWVVRRHLIASRKPLHLIFVKMTTKYKIVLLRHGESTWNKENRFTGWTDVDLSEKGIEEAHTAGKVQRNF